MNAAALKAANRDFVLLLRALDLVGGEAGPRQDLLARLLGHIAPKCAFAGYRFTPAA